MLLSTYRTPCRYTHLPFVRHQTDSAVHIYIARQYSNYAGTIIARKWHAANSYSCTTHHPLQPPSSNQFNRTCSQAQSLNTVQSPKVHCPKHTLHPKFESISWVTLIIHCTFIRKGTRGASCPLSALLFKRGTRLAQPANTCTYD